MYDRLHGLHFSYFARLDCSVFLYYPRTKYMTLLRFSRQSWVQGEQGYNGTLDLLKPFLHTFLCLSTFNFLWLCLIMEQLKEFSSSNISPFSVLRIYLGNLPFHLSLFWCCKIRNMPTILISASDLILHSRARRKRQKAKESETETFWKLEIIFIRY